VCWDCHCSTQSDYRCNDASLLVSCTQKTTGVLLIFVFDGRDTHKVNKTMSRVMGDCSDVQLQSMSLIYLFIYLFIYLLIYLLIPRLRI
jgi:hypothetical protein